MAHQPPPPQFVNSLLDSCAFNPNAAESEAAQQIQKLGEDGEVVLIIAHSNQKEVDHPNTPAAVKQAAAGLIYTLDAQLTEEEKNLRNAIHDMLTGNGKPEKYAADAHHVFEAAKYGGYFITTDARILGNRAELCKLAGVAVVTPTEWLKEFESGK